MAAPKNTQKKLPLDCTVDESFLNVKYWRAEFSLLLPVFDSLTGLADMLAKEDSFFAGAKGIFRLQNIKRGNSGEDQTRQTVKAMRRLIQKDPIRKRVFSSMCPDVQLPSQRD